MIPHSKIKRLVRTLRWMGVLFLRYSQEEIAAALAPYVDDEAVAFPGQFLLDIFESKLLPPNEGRKCIVCGQYGDALDARANAIYCSSRCRQKAYRKRKAQRYGNKINSEHRGVTKRLTVTDHRSNSAGHP